MTPKASSIDEALLFLGVQSGSLADFLNHNLAVRTPTNLNISISWLRYPSTHYRKFLDLYYRISGQQEAKMPAVTPA